MLLVTVAYTRPPCWITSPLTGVAALPWPMTLPLANSSTVPLPTVTVRPAAVKLPRPVFVASTVPALMVKLPVKVLAPVNSSKPLPVLDIGYPPLITPES